TNRASAIDGRTTRHPGYAVSQIIRKRIEESFAWTKTIAGLHKTKHRGVGRVCKLQQPDRRPIAKATPGTSKDGMMGLRPRRAIMGRGALAPHRAKASLSTP